MSKFVLHPEAYADLDEIWEYIAADNLDAADRVLDEIHQAILPSFVSRRVAMLVRTLPPALYDFKLCEIMRSHMRLTRSRSL